MRTLLKALLLLCLSSLAYSQGFPIKDTVVDSNGHPVPSAVVRVCTEPASGTTCTPLAANIYQDRGLSIPIANPTTADLFGNVIFYVACGSRYHLQFTSTSTQQRDSADVIPQGCAIPLSVGYTFVSFTATPSFDASLSSFYSMTLTGNVTSSTFANGSAGSVLDVMLCQDGAGSHTFAFPANVASSPGVSQPATAPSSCTGYTFNFDGNQNKWFLFSQPISNAVTSVFGRTGAVVAATNDYTFTQIGGIAGGAGGIAANQLGTGTANTSTYLRGDLSWQATPVTSVFGRTGAVVAASNDYNFNQLAGTAAVTQGGTGNTSLTANAFFYGNGTGALSVLAPSGAGVNCLTETAGGVPAWGGCSGLASFSWSSIVAPTGNEAFNTSTFTTTITFGALAASPTVNQWLMQDTTGNTNLGCLLCVSSIGSSTALPIEFTAQGTSNGIKMDVNGKIQKLGTGGIADAALSSNVALYNNGSETWGNGGGNIVWTVSPGSGNQFQIVGANATSGVSLQFIGGNSGSNNAGGGVLLTGATGGGSGAGGAITLQAGIGGASGAGGDIFLSTGSAGGGVNPQGRIVIEPGNNSGGGLPSTIGGSFFAMYYDSTLQALRKNEGGFAYESVGPPNVIEGTCSGTASAASTIFLFPLGDLSALTCTSTAAQPGLPMPSNGVLRNLRVVAGSAGVAGGSGVFTVLQNGVATTITCTVGTGTTCSDTTHTVSFAAGDRLGIQFTTQGGETLANIAATVERQ